MAEEPACRPLRDLGLEDGPQDFTECTDGARVTSAVTSVSLDAARGRARKLRHHSARLRTAVLLAVGLAMLGASRHPDAVELSVSDILTSPDRYAGQPVVLKGKVTNLISKTSRKGDPRFVFDLSDGVVAIPVLAAGRPSCEKGAMATVEGRVEVWGRRTPAFVRVEATRVSCP
jgi:hypothetical protein